MLTIVNASCTCLSGIDSSDEKWEFHVRAKRNDSGMTTYPLTLAVTETLEIDVIQTLYVPDTLQKLSIIGVGDMPQSLEFIPEYRNQPSHELPIGQTLDASPSLTSIELVNIDMFTMTTTVAGFVPPSTTSLTLRNCNITSFGFEFTEGMNNLTQLDLSSNNMDSAYAGTENQLYADQCSLSLCGLEEYNLSFNNLTVFPTTPFNVETLKKFYIQGNAISNFTVNTSIFERIITMMDFKANLVGDAVECDSGDWKSAYGAKFCVSDTISSPPPGTVGTV
ncbi:hypothetical protein PHYBOEH_001019 [Phytophthora boehmeriae]|uniref:TKL protein kinase n=1 Tax=Phytophthora boehmeriae TaxID=109152 RepID=A0A8T1X7Z3_9STRA|nr:hypothetical protein PHYBOEH_001019 [Phytophthora boehmeriae]